MASNTSNTGHEMSGNPGSQTATRSGSSRRGFASMDRSRQREIASRGGRAAHEKGTAHEFSRDEAREAGRKGGIAVSSDRRHMAEIGRQGGKARGSRKSNGGAAGADGSPDDNGNAAPAGGESAFSAAEKGNADGDSG